MSDGSLSQDEIDALLSGESLPDIPESTDSNDLNDTEKNTIKELLDTATVGLGEAMTALMVKNTNISIPSLNVVSKELFLSTLPDEVVEIQSALKGSISGSHLYVISKDDALKIAVPMIGQDELELNGTTISAVSEAMSQFCGIVLTTIGDNIHETMLPEPPEGQSIPKAMLNLPGDRFVHVTYYVQIESMESITIHEIFELSLIKSILSQLNIAAGSQTDIDPFTAMMAGNKQPMATSMNSPMMGGLGGGQSPPNVQGVQLPNLSPINSPSEQRNIGLLMDVSMELTVELGRTKWKIKDILGMGDGTIIELDKLAGEPVDILVNSNLLAKGEVVVIDENFGVRVTEIVATIERIAE